MPKGKINVNVEDGVVYLRGELEQPDLIEDLEAQARKVQGVRAVENLLRQEASPRPASSPLTGAEGRVARLLTEGARNKEIANHLGVSESTIKNHLHNIYVKLNLSSRGELAHWYQTGARLNGSPGSRSIGGWEAIAQPSPAA